jgi:hypothetical protein
MSLERELGGRIRRFISDDLTLHPMPKDLQRRVLRGLNRTPTIAKTLGLVGELRLTAALLAVVLLIGGGFGAARWLSKSNPGVAGTSRSAAPTSQAATSSPHTSISPPGRVNAAMAFDPSTQSVLLFGGLGTSTYLSDTWAWDGKHWTLLRPTVQPPRRENAKLTYDPQSRRLLLFGGDGPVAPGSDSQGDFGDTWTWDGSNWTELHPAHAPSPRTLASMTTDEASRDVMLFGGEAGGMGASYFSDTWIWNGNDWRQASTANKPTGRAMAGMAFAPTSNEVLLYGGTGVEGGLSDTWLWNGQTWLRQSSPGPAVSDAAVSTTHGGVVLFGGTLITSGSVVGDTWIFDGAAWHLQAGGGPSPRWGCAVAFDSTAGTTILFGGNAATEPKTLDYVPETWVFNGLSWTLG